MGKHARLCLLGAALFLLPVLCHGEGGESRSADSSKSQPAPEHKSAETGSSVVKGPGAEVPEKYIGTWVLDKEATGKEIADHAPAKVKERWLREAGDMGRWQWAISADKLIASITSTLRDPQVAEFRVELKEEGPELTILSNVEPGGPGPEVQAFHLRLIEDGSLRMRMTDAKGWADDDELMRYFVYRKETGGASTSAGRGTNQAVAYLDALKTCTTGEFHFSYAGLGDFRNTILGREDGRCQVKIVHSNMNLACSFSDETITLLTSAQKYENAKKGVLEGSTDSEESARLNRECQMN